MGRALTFVAPTNISSVLTHCSFLPPPCFLPSQLSVLVLILPCPLAADDCVSMILVLPAFTPFLTGCGSALLAFP